MFCVQALCLFDLDLLARRLTMHACVVFFVVMHGLMSAFSCANYGNVIRLETVNKLVLT
jgi:hypothetical protein